MKKYTFTYILILITHLLPAQDIIKIKKLQPINGKVIIATPEYIQFITKGDSANSVKKTPRYLVEYIQYNGISEDSLPSTTFKRIIDSVTLVKSSPEDVDLLASTLTDQSEYENIKSGYVFSGLAAAGALVCGGIVIFKKEPEVPKLPSDYSTNSKAAQEYNLKAAEYAKESDTYTANIRIITGIGIGLAGVAIIASAINGYELTKISKKNSQKRLTLIPTPNNFFISYRF